MKTKIILGIIIFSFLLFALMPRILAQNSEQVSSNQILLEEPGILPDSDFYFLKIWKEKIQLFFTFRAENKAKLYLHLSEIRLVEYQKMIEQNKFEIAQQVLEKYQNQLNLALEKLEQIKSKGQNVESLSQKISVATLKHTQVIEQNLLKNPDQAAKGLNNALEASQKGYLKAQNALKK